jgi:hypothetical protein
VPSNSIKNIFFILICFLFTKIFLSSRHCILFFPAPSSFSCFVFYFSRLPAASSPPPPSSAAANLYSFYRAPLNFIDLVGEEKSANVDI